jgi:hypothetical protein
MPYVKVGQENSGSIDPYYEDLGPGSPVVGSPSSCCSIFSVKPGPDTHGNDLRRRSRGLG